MPFADDYQITQYVNEDVTPTGTPDVSAENLLNTENGVKELFGAMAAIYDSHEDLQAAFDALAGSEVVEDTTFISGLHLEWLSTTQVRITSGFCYVPAAGLVSSLAASTTLTPTLAADTWYYVYGMNVSGNLSFEASTTVPVAYRGTAKQKTGDASRRFIGAFKTNASSQIMRFLKGGDYVGWLENVYTVPLWVAGSTHATNTLGAITETAIALAGAMPSHSRFASLTVSIVESSDYLLLGNSDDGVTLAEDTALWQNDVKSVNDPRTGIFGIDRFPTNATQQITYRWQTSAPGNARHMHVRGYYEDR